MQVGVLRVSPVVYDILELSADLLFVIRFVGNTMATFVMQSLGCEVAGINTVHYSKDIQQSVLHG